MVVASLQFSAEALEPGTASGTVTLDQVITKLQFASSGTEENLFDSSKLDTIVAVTDRPLGGTSPADRFEISSQVGRGDLVAVVPRFAANKLVNVGFGLKGENSLILLPAQWFQSSFAADGSGTLKLSPRTSDGHAYACDLQFHAKAYEAPAVEPEPVPVATPEPAAAPLAPATTSFMDPKVAADLLIAALMQKDEHQALELIKLGADPNGRDAYGIGVLNYAVMMCMPKVVQALVDKKADLKYERAPGMTIMTEAGACPEAATILKNAGAH